MSAEPVDIRNGNLVFPQGVDPHGELENRLQRRLGRGLYIQDTFQTSDGALSLKLGVSYPKDVSDRREPDKVMKYINIGDVYTLSASATGDGYYNVELPERSNIEEALQSRRQEVVNRLDYSMARTIFDDVYQLDPVKNQLNSLNQIVRWLWKEGEISEDRLTRIQRGRTEEYLQVLENFDFVWVQDGMVRPGEKMEAADIHEGEDGEGEDIDIEEYQKVIVGQIIKDAYSTLRDQLDLRMLNHYPKYANSYYYSAIQKQDANLHLTIEDLQANLKQEWDDDVDELILEDKLRKLKEVNVIEEEDGYYTGNAEILESVSDATAVNAVAD